MKGMGRTERVTVISSNQLYRQLCTILVLKPLFAFILFLALTFAKSDSKFVLYNTSMDNFTVTSIKTSRTSLTSLTSIIDNNDSLMNVFPNFNDRPASPLVRHPALYRELAVGDFDRFNELFKNAVIALPDSDIEQNYLKIGLTNLKCYDIVIGDIQTQWSLYNSTSGGVSEGFAESLAFDINVNPFALSCSADYNFVTGLLGLIKGSGSFVALLSNSLANLQLLVNSVTGFQYDFPSAAEVKSCDVTLNIDSIDFSQKSGILDDILDSVNGLISDVVQNRARDAICQELDTLGPGLLNGLLNTTKSRLELWTQQLSSEASDPLFVETNFTTPLHSDSLDIPELLNFKNNSTIRTSSLSNSLPASLSSSSSSLGITDILVFAMMQAKSFLGNVVDDANGPTQNKSDLSINVLLRQSSLLDENRVFHFDPNNITNDVTLQQESFDPVLVQMHDKLTQTNISMTKLRVKGLDTLTDFTPFIPIGKYTIQNTMTWSSLSLDIDLQIVIKPSSLPDSILINPDPIEIVESITVTIDFTGISLNASIFVAIDTVKLEVLQIGSLLYTENLLPCILDTVYDFQVSGLTVHVDDMTEPVMTGFVTPGIDRVISSATSAAMIALEPTILKAMPNIFQGPVRDILNKKFLDGLVLNENNHSSTSNNDNNTRYAQCPKNEQLMEIVNDAQMPLHVDFRDLLLNTSESIQLGGLGNEMYGTIVSRLFHMVEQEFLLGSSDASNTSNNTNITSKNLRINTILVEPYTESQSGLRGMMALDGILFQIGESTNETISGQSYKNSSNNNNRRQQREIKHEDIVRTRRTASKKIITFPSIFLENRYTMESLLPSTSDDRYPAIMSLSNLHIHNLNTISDPLILLQPTKNGQIITNELNIGNVNQPLNISAQLVIQLFGATNVLEISASVRSLRLIVDVMALIKTEAFMKFPIGGALQLDCWLATIEATELNPETGVAMSGTLQHGLALHKIRTTMAGYDMDAVCISCEHSPGMKLLPWIIELFDATNVTRIIGERIPIFIDSILSSSTFQNILDRRVDEAPMFCPTNLAYNESATRPVYDSKNNQMTLPAIDSKSIDTILFTGALLGEVGFVIFSESQRQLQTLEPIANDNNNDPLSAQNMFIPPSGMRLIDWTNLSKSTGYGTIVDELFNATRNALFGNFGSTRINSSSTESNDIGSVRNGGIVDMNTLLSGYLEKNGALDLKPEWGLDQEDFMLKLSSIRVFGVDDMNLYEVLEPIGPQTLSMSAQFQSLQIELDIVADSPTTRNEPPQKVMTSFQVTNLTVDVAIFAAFDLDRIGRIQLGSLLDTRTALSCILSTAYNFHVPQMKVTIDSFTNPTFTGYMPDTGSTLQETTDKIFDQYKQNIIDAIPVIFSGVVKESISNIVQTYYKDSKCPLSPVVADFASQRGHIIDEETLNSSQFDFVDFRDLFLSEAESIVLGGSGTSPYGNLVHIAYKYIYDQLLKPFANNTALAMINEKVIAKITKSQSGNVGEWKINGDLFHQNRQVQVGGLNALIRLRAYDLYFRNLDTIASGTTSFTPLSSSQHQQLGFLVPVANEPYILNNTASVGIIAERPLTVGLSFMIGIEDDVTKISNDLDISIGMDELHLVLAALIKISEKAFFQFPIQDVANIHCWLATIPAPVLDERGVRIEGSEETLTVQDFLASVQKIIVKVKCKDCSGPQMDQFSELLSSHQNSKAVTDMANLLFESGTRMIKGEYLQFSIDRALNDAKKKCPHNRQYDPTYVASEYASFDPDAVSESLSFIVALVIVCATLLVAVASIHVTLKVLVRRRHHKWLNTLSREQISNLYKRQNMKLEKEIELNSTTVSMFASANVIPLWIRLGMPVVILGNIGFFLSGHISLGASVTVLISLGGQTFQSDNFFSFSMAKSTIEIWNAGGQILALMIFFASFAWPYSKQLITLALWFSPTKIVSVSTRGNLFIWLDILAKWSIVDIFVLVITIVCLRISIQSPDVPFLPSGFYQIDLLLVPKWGLYANMIAQLISQVSSHYIIHFHRKLVDAALNRHLQTQSTALGCSEDDEDIDDANTNSSSIPPPNQQRQYFVLGRPTDVNGIANRLCTHAFRRVHRGESDKLIARRHVGPILVILSMTLSVLCAVGCALPTFSVDILGIVGIFVESGQSFTAATTNYSLFDVIKVLFRQAALTGGLNDYFGLGTLSLLVVVSVLIVPIIQSVALLVQWFVKLTQVQRNKVTITLEILQAWQYAEVYLLSIIVAAWQLGPISQYMINPYCEALEGFFGQLVYFGIIENVDAQCLKTDINVEPTFYLLFATALVLAAINTFVMNAVNHYVDDMESREIDNGVQKAATLMDLGRMELEDMTVTTSTKSQLLPVPLMFTDRFRWFLQREDAIVITQETQRIPSRQQATSQVSPSSMSDMDIDCTVNRSQSLEVEDEPSLSHLPSSGTFQLKSSSNRMNPNFDPIVIQTSSSFDTVDDHADPFPVRNQRAVPNVAELNTSLYHECPSMLSDSKDESIRDDVLTITPSQDISDLNDTPQSIYFDDIPFMTTTNLLLGQNNFQCNDVADDGNDDSQIHFISKVLS